MDEIRNMKHKESYGEENRKYSRNRSQYKLALRLIDCLCLDGKTKILDLGCGMGEFDDILKEINNDFKIICIDGVDTFVSKIKQRGYECYRIDLEDMVLPFKDNEFDLIISLDVIEHLWNTENYLHEIGRVLKHSGHAIFTTINYNWWKYRFQHLIGNFDKYTYKSRHKKFYTVQSIKNELEKYFNIKKIIGLHGYPKIILNNKNIINLTSREIGVLCTKINS